MQLGHHPCPPDPAAAPPAQTAASGAPERLSPGPQQSTRRHRSRESRGRRLPRKGPAEVPPRAQTRRGLLRLLRPPRLPGPRPVQPSHNSLLWISSPSWTDLARGLGAPFQGPRRPSLSCPATSGWMQERGTRAHRGEGGGAWAGCAPPLGARRLRTAAATPGSTGAAQRRASSARPRHNPLSPGTHTLSRGAASRGRP